MYVEFDDERGEVRAGGARTAFAPAGRSGELRLGGPSGPVVRAVSFGERGRAGTAALAAPDPAAALCAALRRAALEPGDGVDDGLLDVALLALAGGDEEAAPPFAETALLVLRSTGGELASLLSAPAVEVDRLALALSAGGDDGWTRVAFAPATPALAAVRSQLAAALLGRAAPVRAGDNLVADDHAAGATNDLVPGEHPAAPTNDLVSDDHPSRPTNDLRARPADDLMAHAADGLVARDRLTAAHDLVAGGGNNFVDAASDPVAPAGNDFVGAASDPVARAGNDFVAAANDPAARAGNDFVGAANDPVAAGHDLVTGRRNDFAGGAANDLVAGGANDSVAAAHGLVARGGNDLVGGANDLGARFVRRLAPPARAALVPRARADVVELDVADALARALHDEADLRGVER